MNDGSEDRTGMEIAVYGGSFNPPHLGHREAVITALDMLNPDLLLIPGDKPFKTKYLSKQINSSRLSFGSAEKMMELLNIAPGSVSVFGLMNDKEKAVNLLIDEDLKNDEYIGFHPCKNTSTLKIRYDDLLERFLPGINRTFQYVELPWTFDEE